MHSNPHRAVVFSINEETLRILIIDDDPIQNAFVEAYLTSATVSVSTTTNAGEGLRRLDEDDFDLVIVDCDMPVLNGVSLVKALRGSPKNARIPVIMLTGRRDPATLKAAYEAGINELLIKPVKGRMLAQQVRQLFDRRFTL